MQNPECDEMLQKEVAGAWDRYGVLIRTTIFYVLQTELSHVTVCVCVCKGWYMGSSAIKRKQNLENTHKSIHAKNGENRGRAVLLPTPWLCCGSQLCISTGKTGVCTTFATSYQFTNSPLKKQLLLTETKFNENNPDMCKDISWSRATWSRACPVRQGGQGFRLKKWHSHC